MPVTLTTELLMQKESSLQSMIKTNYGLNVNACRVYFIQEEDNLRTQGLTRDAVAKIVIRDMRVSSRRPPNHVNYQEHISRIYIWSNCTITKLPYEYADAIIQWINEVVLSISPFDSNSDSPPLPSIAEASEAETSEIYESS
jgi:hypothetical protein